MSPLNMRMRSQGPEKVGYAEGAVFIISKAERGQGQTLCLQRAANFQGCPTQRKFCQSSRAKKQTTFGSCEHHTEGTIIGLPGMPPKNILDSQRLGCCGARPQPGYGVLLAFVPGFVVSSGYCTCTEEWLVHPDRFPGVCKIRAQFGVELARAGPKKVLMAVLQRRGEL